MQFTFATIALAAASIVSAQGISSVITPTASAPAGCSTDYAGNFEITVVLPPSMKKRDVVQKRQSTTCASDGTLVATLKGGVLTDAKGRIGEIVANRQFQFDGPPAQTGSIYTGGFSVCNNGSLAIGGQNIFYQCLSGSFYNLYDQSTGAQCEQVLIDIIPCSVSSGTTTAAGVTQTNDGQPMGSSATAAATQKTDGQPQVSSATKLATQISDGQIQASSAVPKPVSQFTDGQIQVTATPVPAAQITDGQIQASSAATKSVAAVSQISDGQVQATSAAAPISQISDGQIQATSAATLKTSTKSVAPVSQISDGQIQATAASNATITKASASPSQFTGAASMLNVGAQFVAGAAAVAAVALL